MKHFQNIWWFLGFVSLYVIALAGTEKLLVWIMPSFGISPNQATAGAYTSEMVVLVSCGAALLARVVMAMNTARNFNRALKVLSSRRALASLAVVGMVAVQIQNRGQWWVKHMFTDESYNHVEYTATASSLLYGLSLIALIFAVYPTRLSSSKVSLADFGSDKLAIIISALAAIGFVVGKLMYTGRL